MSITHAVPSRSRPRWRPSVRHLILMPVSLLFLLPLEQMILASLMTPAEINAYPPTIVPSRLQLDGYIKLFTEAPVLRWLGNSLAVVVIAVASHMVLCSLAGYGFARLRFRGRNVSFVMLLATIMIPIQLLMIPTYIIFAKVGWLDTLAAAFVPWLASAFGIFLMRQFFVSLPVELEEAARIDGASTFQIFWKVILPLARPALATLAVFTLLYAWNDLLWPLIAISDPDWYTIQLGLANFQGQRRTDWSLLMAGNVVATLPLLLAFLIAQKQFVATMTLTGLK